ncbi:hypothetical protein [Aliivibrio logei]|uniref:Uncharacterized protein n=1 Tax=Aliivibrio logei 5S-186 TaxID=626086 RepID=A0ABX3ATK3_ALILO|nr:hypothetical protein [Aliivibrio logei]OEF11836.1 hypothetical protein A1Q5_09845 [Aliivibrio logei 5S-186]
MNRKLLNLAMYTLALSPMYTYALNIESPITAPEGHIKAGVPVFVQDNGQPIYHYAKDGSTNSYIWVDDENNLLGKGVFYTPGYELIGNSVRLCLVDTSSGSECSEPLKVYNTASESQRGRSYSGTDFWTIQDNIAQTSEITVNDTTLPLETTVTLLSGGESLGSQLPAISNLFYTLTAGATPLVSMVPYTAEYPLSATSTLQESNAVDLTGLESLELCSLAFYNQGNPTFEMSTQCDIRLVLPDTVDKTNGYVYPPTIEQFTTLFPDKEYIASPPITVDGEDVSFVYAPRKLNGVESLSKYCEYVSDTAKPLTAAEIATFVASADFDTTWPKDTSYWSNEEIAGPFTIPGVSWANVVIPDGARVGEIEPASNELYNGYYFCYDDTAVTGTK